MGSSGVLVQKASRSTFLPALAIIPGACLLLLAACGDSPEPTPTNATSTPTIVAALPLTGVPAIPTLSPLPSDGEPGEEARVQIYRQVVAALLNDEKPPRVYISPYLGVSERLDVADANSPVPAALLDALQASDVGPTYELLDFSEAIANLEDGGAVKDDGVFLTLGPIERTPGGAGTVQVRGSIYRKVGDAEGLRFTLGQDAATSAWTVLSSEREWSDDEP